MFINKASNQLEGLKKLLESNVLDIDYNEMDSDPLFKVEKIIDHKINDKGQPMLYVQWDKLGEDKSWEKLHDIRADEPLLVADYIV